MSYSLGWDSTNNRHFGYGVPCVCEHPGCNQRIDRGMGYACGGGHPEDGCGRYFCGVHGGGGTCVRCAKLAEPFSLKPDTAEWMLHKLTDPSWAEWRETNPAEVAQIRTRLSGGSDLPAIVLDALIFYASSDHFIKADPDAWDTVSGEPPNLWCDEAGTATVEDGSIAKHALGVLAGDVPGG